MPLHRRSLRSYPRWSSTFLRQLSTESIPSSSSTSSPPPPNPPPSSRATRSRLIPGPRPSNSSRNQTHSRISPHSQALPQLPHNFGANQLLSVPTTTRHLLESIVSQFDAPIRYAFAYGSGVFEQDGYLTNTPNRPMLDFMFAVSHPSHWHSINLARHPSHYALHARLFGSDFVSRMQDLGPGVWFNPYVTVNGVVRTTLPTFF
jgi:mitochondrial translocator assembly and maintenance protein 41